MLASNNIILVLLVWVRQCVTCKVSINALMITYCHNNVEIPGPLVGLDHFSLEIQPQPARF